MELYDFVGETAEPELITVKDMSGKEKPKLLKYAVGNRVYDIAWEAYIDVLQHRKAPIPEKPKDSELRLAFPPST